MSLLELPPRGFTVAVGERTLGDVLGPRLVLAPRDDSCLVDPRKLAEEDGQQAKDAAEAAPVRSPAPRQPSAA
ncbi:hypothetical protein [Deinococcus yavapaiensis]|uniref:hypothetical protein n=1 Tax=Deinococcus yavapaiensis TaxID=309889 RepID=UPI0011B69E3C|nr:hypothetical protein [Deinococcus yavapaiensis]